MRIVFIGGRDILILGGIENYMYNLATQLVRLGHEPIIFCESDKNRVEWINGFRVIYHKGPKSPILCKPILGLRSTLKTLRKFKRVDFIHYNAWPPALSAPFARLFGKRTVFFGHGLEWKRSKYSPFQQRLNKIAERLSTSFNRYLMMCSDEQTRYYKDEYDRLAVTIPTAINPPDLERPLKTDIFKKFHIVPKRFFLFLGRLVQDKNPDFLIRAFREAHLEGYQLVIAGNNPANPNYVERLHRLAESDPDIIFTDVVYGDAKEWLLRNAFAFCIPSTLEGLSISLLESMSYGLPPIASRIGANEEVLSEEDAFWCRPEDVTSLSRALRDAVGSDRLQEMADRNRERVLNDYTWEKVTEKYVRTLQDWKDRKKKRKG